MDLLRFEKLPQFEFYLAEECALRADIYEPSHRKLFMIHRYDQGYKERTLNTHGLMSMTPWEFMCYHYKWS